MIEVEVRRSSRVAKRPAPDYKVVGHIYCIVLLLLVMDFHLSVVCLHKRESKYERERGDGNTIAL